MAFYINPPFHKGSKGGGTTNAKQSAGSKGKRVRSSKSNVSGTAANSLEDWVKQDWRQVANPSKKCGEK